jgi:hypothetical protein
MFVNPINQAMGVSRKTLPLRPGDAQRVGCSLHVMCLKRGYSVRR